MHAPCYFLAGVGYDFILTLYYIAVDERRQGAAAVLSGVLTFMALYVVNDLIERGGRRRRKLALVAAYAIGNGVGTAVAMTL